MANVSVNIAVPDKRKTHTNTRFYVKHLWGSPTIRRRMLTSIVEASAQKAQRLIERPRRLVRRRMSTSVAIYACRWLCIHDLMQGHARNGHHMPAPTETSMLHIRSRWHSGRNHKFSSSRSCNSMLMRCVAPTEFGRVEAEVLSVICVSAHR